jgi:hypothetical protein
MRANSARSAIVEPGGDQVAAHVGLHAIGCFANRLGLGSALSWAVPVLGERLPVHDRGKVLVQAALMLAGGGESCLDIEHLRAQGDLHKRPRLGISTTPADRLMAAHPDYVWATSSA